MTQPAKITNPYQQARLIYEQRATRHLWLERVLDNPTAIVVLFLIHLALGQIIRNTPGLGLVQALLVFAVGLYWAISSRYPLIYPAYAVAYIVGNEILWRMNEVPIPWEIAKYSTIVIFSAAWLRVRRGKMPFAPLLYILCLLPGALYTLFGTVDKTHTLLSNYMSGPVALFVCLVYFSNQVLKTAEVRRLFLLVTMPVAGIAMVTTVQVITQKIKWANDSNNYASGDFGANQVSTALGLGWTLLVLTGVFLLKRSERFLAVLIVPLVLWMITQNFITFSRGGLIEAAVAAVAGGIFLIVIPTKRILLFIGIFIGIIFLIIVFPLLDDGTRGNLTLRYQISLDEEELSNRDRIIQNEIDIFEENPLSGAGLGQSVYLRYDMLTWNIASHTEYTRLLADHGLLGVAANVLIVTISLQAFLKQKTWTGRAITAALIVWALLYMFHASTRTVAFAFTFGIAFAQLATDQLPVRDPSKSVPKPMPMIAPVGVKPQIATHYERK